VAGNSAADTYDRAQIIRLWQSWAKKALSEIWNAEDKDHIRGFGAVVQETQCSRMLI